MQPSDTASRYAAPARSGEHRLAHLRAVAAVRYSGLALLATAGMIMLTVTGLAVTGS
jgi:hypothetical protein